MKNFFTIFSLIFFLLISDCFAQEDTTTVKKRHSVDVEDEIIPELQRNKKKKDVFIDRDGDGICDERAEGMSFEKLRKRKRSGQGQGGGGGRQN
jgi:hypothetical protein